MSVAHPSPGGVPEFSLGDGFRLREIHERDAGEMYEIVVGCREYLSEWMPWAAGQTLETTLEFIRLSQRQVADNRGFQTAIVDGQRIIGTIGFHTIMWEHRSTSMGYWIIERAQRRGVVTRAVRALTDHSFNVWNLNRVEIRAGVANQRSRAIPERLGFVHEGVLREAELVGDRFLDHAVYSMLARDWPSAR